MRTYDELIMSSEVAKALGQEALLYITTEELEVILNHNNRLDELAAMIKHAQRRRGYVGTKFNGIPVNVVGVKHE